MMKTIRIIERTIKEKTGFKRYPFKNARQVTIIQGEKVFKNHYEDINNPRLRVKFVETFKTRSKKELQAYIDKLGRTDTEKWMKSILNEMLVKQTTTYTLGLNETLRVVKQSLRNGGYQVFTNNGNIYVADIGYGNVVHHRDGRITYKDCYLVKDEYITYDNNLDDYTLSDCGGKEYNVVIREENLFGFAKIRKYRGVK